MRLTRRFLARNRRVLAQLRAARATDFAAVAAAAHRLKGTAGAYGFSDLTPLAAALGDAAARGDGGETRRLLTTLAAALAVAARSVPPDRRGQPGHGEHQVSRDPRADPEA